MRRSNASQSSGCAASSDGGIPSSLEPAAESRHYRVVVYFHEPDYEVRINRHGPPYEVLYGIDAPDARAAKEQARSQFARDRLDSSVHWACEIEKVTVIQTTDPRTVSHPRAAVQPEKFPPLEPPPRLLFVSHLHWGISFSELWYREFGIPISMVSDFDSVPFDDLPQFRAVLLNNIGFLEADRNLLPEDPAQAETSPDRLELASAFPNEYCLDVGLIERIRWYNPEITIIVINNGQPKPSQEYFDSGADYVFELESELLVSDILPRLFRSLLAS